MAWVSIADSVALNRRESHYSFHAVICRLCKSVNLFSCRTNSCRTVGERHITLDGDDEYAHCGE